MLLTYHNHAIQRVSIFLARSGMHLILLMNESECFPRLSAWAARQFGQFVVLRNESAVGSSRANSAFVPNNYEISPLRQKVNVYDPTTGTHYIVPCHCKDSNPEPSKPSIPVSRRIELWSVQFVQTGITAGSLCHQSKCNPPVLYSEPPIKLLYHAN